MELYKKNLKKLIKGKVYDRTFEHDACGVGFIASTEGKKSRQVVEFGIQALKAVWHRGAVDADGKTGDGAGIHIEIPKDFFIQRIENAGRKHKEGIICVGMIFLPKNDYTSQEKCKTIVENELLSKNTEEKLIIIGDLKNKLKLKMITIMKEIELNNLTFSKKLNNILENLREYYVKLMIEEKKYLNQVGKTEKKKEFRESTLTSTSKRVTLL